MSNILSTLNAPACEVCKRDKDVGKPFCDGCTLTLTAARRQALKLEVGPAFVRAYEEAMVFLRERGRGR